LVKWARWKVTDNCVLELGKKDQHSVTSTTILPGNREYGVIVGRRQNKIWERLEMYLEV